MQRFFFLIFPWFLLADKILGRENGLRLFLSSCGVAVLSLLHDVLLDSCPKLIIPDEVRLCMRAGLRDSSPSPIVLGLFGWMKLLLPPLPLYFDFLSRYRRSPRSTFAFRPPEGSSSPVFVRLSLFFAFASLISWAARLNEIVFFLTLALLLRFLAYLP